MGCRVALLRLEREGRIVLPAARRKRPERRAGQAAVQPPACPDVTGTLDDLGAISLKLVRAGMKESTVWNALMDAYHPLRSGPLCGAQLRYLIMSEKHGPVGGFAVSASAWRLEARDKWLGWDDAGRLADLEGVVCNSRFLILPTVQVKHLASHALGQLTQRIRPDWQKTYGVSPWLMETFVEPPRRGSCYLAANWIEIGLTSGRGRQDKENVRGQSKPPAAKKPIKDKTARARREAAEKAAQPTAGLDLEPSPDTAAEAGAGNGEKKSKRTPKPKTPGVRKRVFVYPLCRESLKKIGHRHAPAEPGAQPRGEWLHREFGRATLGDRRLNRRLLQVAGDFSASPTAAIPEACGGSLARIGATYRFLSHERITMDTIIKPHRLATLERMRGEPVTLAATDSSSLNYTTHATLEDIGPIGRKADGAQGMILHSVMVFRPDGLPLGVLHADCIRRDPAEHGKKRERASRPIEEKESYKWIEALGPVEEAARQCPGARTVVVADREADIYEFFIEARKKKLDLLVRAKEDRLVAGTVADLKCAPTPGQPPARLWRQMLRVVEAAQSDLEIPARPGLPKRTARMSLRYAQITFEPPENKPDLPRFEAWVVWADEISTPPKPTQRVEWMLITTVAVQTLEDAFERLRWYARRWGIEVFHRVLKSGCKTEQRQLGTADRIETCLAIDMVVAWRVQHITWLARALPDEPCSVAFSEDEWVAVLTCVTRRPAPDTPPTLREMTHIVARLGGYISGKSRGEPGAQTLWRGLARMETMASALRVYRECYPYGMQRPPPREDGQALRA